MSGASRQRQRVCSRKYLMAAARRSAVGAVQRNNEPTAPISSKRHPIRRVRLACSQSLLEHGPGQSPVPHTQGRDHSSQKASGAERAR
jgi:hypothetical protein